MYAYWYMGSDGNWTYQGNVSANSPEAAIEKLGGKVLGGITPQCITQSKKHSPDSFTNILAGFDARNDEIPPQPSSAGRTFFGIF